MPVGAIVFVEHWVFPKIGLTQYWIWRRKKLVNLPALLAWGLTLAGAVTLWLLGYIHEFFLIIPVWLSTAIMYIVLSAFCGARKKLPALPEEESITSETPPASDKRAFDLPGKNTKSSMYYICGLIAVLSLLVCFGLSIWVAVSEGSVYAARMDAFKKAILYATIVYFIFGTIWISMKERKSAKLS